MRLRTRHSSLIVIAILLMGLSSFSAPGYAQQVIARGALGRPDKVMDDTQQWTTPLPLVEDKDVEIYIPDVSTPEWLERNYRAYIDKGQYVITIFTFYKNTKACEANMIGWGYADAAHLNSCVDIGYRLRQVTVETATKTVSLMSAAMIDQNGNIVPDSEQTIPMVRQWVNLDANSQKVLAKTSEIVAKQMKIYDAKVQRTR